MTVCLLKVGKTESPGILLATELRSSPSPAEVQQSPSGAGNAAVHPGQEVELGDGARLVGLQVLQVEAAHQEVLAPDVLRDQVDLDRGGAEAREAVSMKAKQTQMYELQCHT